MGNLFADKGSGSDSDPDGEPIEVDLPSTYPATGISGTVATFAKGNFSYTPPVNVSGIAIFDYPIVDSSGASSTAEVSIMIESVNDAPNLLSPPASRN